MKIEKVNKLLVLALAGVLAWCSYFTSPPGVFMRTAHTFLFLAAIPMIVLHAWGKKLPAYGMQLGDWRTGLKYSAILLLVAMPIMAYGAMLGDFKLYYPEWKGALDSWWMFIAFEALVGVIMFSTEFFYRGFLLFSLKDKWWGNLVHSFVYMLVHIGKPWLEVPYSFFAGYAFGWVDLKTNSILPSFLMHFISSVIFDLMVILL
ncbi:MAG: CPBP family intramembrane glutamic endopeptidase [archaeon]